jgi:hypothetical protein
VSSDPIRSHPRGTVLDLLETPAVTPATRRVMQARLAGAPGLAPGEGAPPRHFDAAAFATLRATCARLLALGDHDGPSAEWVAAAIDHRLARGAGDGWRYDALPPDGVAYRRALAGLDALATAEHDRPFSELAGEAQDALLARMQRGDVHGAAWHRLDAPRCFEELLAESVECLYAHPLALDEIGYAGFADAPGWRAVGLDAREPREPPDPGPPPSAARGPTP